MQTQDQTNPSQEVSQGTEVTQTQSAPQFKSLSDTGLSQSEYEALRRGEKVEVAQAANPSAPVDQTTEQKKSEDSDTSETEAKEKQDDDSEEQVAAKSDEDEAEASESEKPKKKGGFQRRIDKLNARYADKEREANYWREQALKASQGAGKVDAQSTSQSKPAKADDTGKPNPDSYETHAEWVEAVADWKADQKLKAMKAEENRRQFETEYQRKVSTYQEKAKAFSKKTADYEEVMADVDDIVASPTITQLIVESEHGPALAYELAKNREEFERINQLSPLSAARELGKIESRLSKASEEKKPEPKKITQAPKPITPVGSGRGAATKSIYDSGLTQSEYERLRAEQMMKRRKA